MLHISENNSGLPDQFFARIIARAEDETRVAVARELKREFRPPLYYVHVGGHHVALCLSSGSKRLLMVTGTSPDFNDEPEVQPRSEPGPNPNYHPRSYTMRSIASDLHKRAKLCQMIAVSRELMTLKFIAQGYPMVDNPDHWKATMDSNVGSRYSFVMVYGRRRFAIEHATGNIYWVSKGGHVNRNKQFGSLDTLEDWNWGWVEPRRRVIY